MGKNFKGSLRTSEFDVLIETIRKARETAGLSQREVARRMGFDETIYGKTERGDRILDVVEFVKLAGSLGVDPLTLLADYLVALQQRRVQSDLPLLGG